MGYNIGGLRGTVMATSNPQPIVGSWLYGVTLDVHSLHSSVSGLNPAGHTTFDTTRSELGELLYRLKYGGDLSAVGEIVECAVRFLAPHRDKIDLIVPVPASTARPHQPVLVLAEGIGEKLGLPVVESVKAGRATRQLKDVMDPDRRRELLAGLYEIDPGGVAGRHVLLFDDLYRSGATMNAITELLLGRGQAASVRTLAITRTRSHQ